MINILDVTKNQPSKFRTRKWVEINDESRGGIYNDKNNQNNNNKFKTSMIASNLCDYSDAYILVKNTASESATINNTNKQTLCSIC